MRDRRSSVVLVLLLALLVVASPARAQGERTVFDQVLDLYMTHDVVLLGEQHDRRLNFEFRMALLKHPKFASTVQDIYIECANSLYQQVLDDFVLRLQDVPTEKLRMVWRNTTQLSGVWDSPIYEEFIRAVRAVNASLRPGRRIRLVAGDPQIDWAVITSPEQIVPFAGRDESAYTAIEKESLQKHRKALVIYGTFHLFWRSWQPLPGAGPHSIGTYLHQKYPRRAYTIAPLSLAYGVDPALRFEALTGIRTAPTLLEVAGSKLAQLPAKALFPAPPGAAPAPGLPRMDPWRDEPIGDLMDAILYLGTGPDDFVGPTADVVNDTAYQTELKRRRALAFPPPPKK